MVDAVGVELDALFIALRHRVVETQALKRAAIALASMVGGNDVVEGALLGAATSQADLDPCAVCSLAVWIRAGLGPPDSPRV